MAKVELNPIRAGIAQTPEESDYTAIQQRILEQDPEIASRKPEAIEKLPDSLQSAIGKLMPFTDQAPENPERAIRHEIRDYLKLVDWSGRAVIKGRCTTERNAADAGPDGVAVEGTVNKPGFRGQTAGALLFNPV